MDLRARGEGAETISSERLFQREREREREEERRLFGNRFGSTRKTDLPSIVKRLRPDRFRSVPMVKLVEEMIWQKMIDESECKDCVFN